VTTNLLQIAVAILIQVESHGDPHKIGDHGLAVGLTQPHPCIVQDVNRWYGTHYTPADRRDPARCIEITRLWLFNAAFCQGIETPQRLAYKWHRPHGRIGKRYREKVRRAMTRRGGK
jgi:hypothetical protein